MVRSTLLFAGGMLVGAAMAGGVMLHRASAEPVSICSEAVQSTPDASLLPPDPLPPLEPAVAMPDTATAAPTTGGPAR